MLSAPHPHVINSNERAWERATSVLGENAADELDNGPIHFTIRTNAFGVTLTCRLEMAVYMCN